MTARKAIAIGFACVFALVHPLVGVGMGLIIWGLGAVLEEGP